MMKFLCLLVLAVVASEESPVIRRTLTYSPIGKHPRIGEYIMDLKFGSNNKKAPCFIDTELGVTWAVTPKCSTCHGNDQRYDPTRSSSAKNLGRKKKNEYFTGEKTAKLYGDLFKERYEVASKLRAEQTYVNAIYDEQGSALEFESKSTCALGLSFASFASHGGYIYDLFAQKRITKKMVGLRLGTYKNSELIFGGENQDIFHDKFDIEAHGLTDEWKADALTRIGLKGYTQILNHKKVIFSTASPYIVVPQDIGSNFLVELSKNGLDCSIDGQSHLIVCSKTAISINDFPPLSIQLNGKDFPIAASEMVEILDSSIAIYKIQCQPSSISSSYALGTPFWRSYYITLIYRTDSSGTIRIGKSGKDDASNWLLIGGIIVGAVILILVAGAVVRYLRLGRCFRGGSYSSGYHSYDYGYSSRNIIGGHHSYGHYNSGGETHTGGGISVGARTQRLHISDI